MQTRLPNGHTVMIRRYADSHELAGSDVSPGDKLPLRYKEKQIEIDYTAFRDGQTERDRRLDAERVRDALTDED